MPAYFSLVFCIKKKEINKRLFKDFVKLLQKKGLTFTGGFMEFSDDPLERIVRINTEKLMANFQVAPDEIRSNNYRQSHWSFGGFSEVRLFVTNFSEDDYCSFHLIVPEEEVFDDAPDKPHYIEASVASLKALALAIWKRKYVEAVQTCLEGDEDIFLDDIRSGEMPSVRPFAMVPLISLNPTRPDGFQYTNIRRKGVLIERV